MSDNSGELPKDCDKEISQIISTDKTTALEKGLKYLKMCLKTVMKMAARRGFGGGRAAEIGGRIAEILIDVISETFERMNKGETIGTAIKNATINACTAVAEASVIKKLLTLIPEQQTKKRAQEILNLIQEESPFDFYAKKVFGEISSKMLTATQLGPLGNFGVAVMGIIGLHRVYEIEKDQKDSKPN